MRPSPTCRRRGGARDIGIIEAVAVIAHGDHVFLAGQSSEVPVEHEHDGPSTVVRHSPRRSGVVDQLEIRDRIADSQGHCVSLMRVVSCAHRHSLIGGACVLGCRRRSLTASWMSLPTVVATVRLRRADPDDQGEMVRRVMSPLATLNS